MRGIKSVVIAVATMALVGAVGVISAAEASDLTGFDSADCILAQSHHHVSFIKLSPQQLKTLCVVYL